jgi:protein-L-isoaspartate(D-aspartate) O-methyltransferase
MVDFALQRLNMVESQVRPSELTDRRIANAMLDVTRESFLPASLQGVAYSDGELMLSVMGDAASNRQVLSPRTVAQMLQSLDLNSNDIVLLIGAGSGYEAALVSKIAQTVMIVESDEDLARQADNALSAQDVSNAVVIHGALADGCSAEGPFDKILINGGVDFVPGALLDQLKDGGRLVAIRRKDGVSRLVRWQREGEQYSLTEFGAAAADVLSAFAKEASFVF